LCKDKTTINCQRSAESIRLFHSGNIGHQAFQKVYAQQVISFWGSRAVMSYNTCCRVFFVKCFWTRSPLSVPKARSFFRRWGPDSIGCKADFLLVSLGLLEAFKLHLDRRLLFWKKWRCGV